MAHAFNIKHLKELVDESYTNSFYLKIILMTLLVTNVLPLPIIYFSGYLPIFVESYCVIILMIYNVCSIFATQILISYYNSSNQFLDKDNTVTKLYLDFLKNVSCRYEKYVDLKSQKMKRFLNVFNICENYSTILNVYILISVKLMGFIASGLIKI